MITNIQIERLLRAILIGDAFEGAKALLNLQARSEYWNDVAWFILFPKETTDETT